MGHIEERVGCKPGHDQAHRNIRRGAYTQGHQQAYGYGACRITGFLTTRGNHIEADVRKKHYPRCAQYAGPTELAGCARVWWYEWMPVVRVDVQSTERDD